jgi:hypothetical protein
MLRDCIGDKLTTALTPVCPEASLIDNCFLTRGLAKAALGIELDHKKANPRTKDFKYFIIKRTKLKLKSKIKIKRLWTD